MAQKTFSVEFEFVSSSAHGDNYTRRVDIKATDAAGAIMLAGLNRVSYFGARGNDNVIDWRIVEVKK